LGEAHGAAISKGGYRSGKRGWSRSTDQRRMSLEPGSRPRLEGNQIDHQEDAIRINDAPGLPIITLS
jgi:hypothetical protein